MISRCKIGTLVRKYHTSLWIFAKQTACQLRQVSKFHVYIPCLCLNILDCESASIGAFSGHYETSRSFVDSSSGWWRGGTVEIIYLLPPPAGESHGGKLGKLSDVFGYLAFCLALLFLLSLIWIMDAKRGLSACQNTQYIPT